MADKNTIRNWFKTGLKPTQAQFWATWDSFWHKDEKIPITAIEDIENILNEKADAEALVNHLTNETAHADLFDGKEDKDKKGIAGGYAPLNNFTKLAIEYLNVVNDLVTGGVDSLLTAEQGKLLQTQIDNINVLLTSDNLNLDNVQELVDAIETVQTSLETILVNDLTTGGTTKALTAEMGKTLKGLIDALTASLDNKLTRDGYTGTAQELKTAIDNIYQPDVLISSVAPTRSVNTFTYPAGQYTYQISKTLRTLIANYVVTIDAATATNLKRVDLIQGKADGTFSKKIGTENAIIAIRPEPDANCVPISFINVFGNTIENPTPITKEISVQDSSGTEKFKITDYFRFRGGIFNESTKEIIVSPLTVNTAYVHSITGNDATAEFQNADRPYKTVDAVFKQWTGDNPAKFVRVVILDSSIYKINGLYPLINFEIFSDFACTLDFTDNTNSNLFSIYNSSYQYSMSFNLRNGTLYNNKNGAGISLQCEDILFDISVNTIYWNSTSDIFFARRVYITYLKKLSLKGSFCGTEGVIKGEISLDELVILPNATTASFNSAGIINVLKINYLSVLSIFRDKETWNIGDVSGVMDFTYSHTHTVKINFNNSNILDGIRLNQNIGTKYFSGTILNTKFIGEAVSRIDRPANINFINLTILNLTGGFVFYGGYITLNVVNCYFKTVGLLYLFRSTNKDGSCIFNFEKSTLRQDVSGTLISFDNVTNVNVNIGGFESNVLQISDLKNTPISFDLTSFKDKKREIIIRSKIDLLGRVLDSNTTYVIDGILTLLSGEYIEVPSGGLTISGYGFDVSKIIKNVAGQSIFSSPVGSSGNFVTNNMEYNSGLGSVFNLVDSDGSHAIELNDINFQSCASLGTLNHYRQFTATTCGVYGCSDGFTLEGAWNGFKLVNTNAFGFGAGGTLVKKGLTTSFANRLYLDLNLSLPTGAKICDFDASNFSSDKLLQVVNCLVKVNGVIDPTTTAATFPNISPFSPKAYFTNNIGIKNSFNEPYGLKTTNMTTYANDVDAATGGIQIGEVYLETSTGYFKTRLS